MDRASVRAVSQRSVRVHGSVMILTPRRLSLACARSTRLRLSWNARLHRVQQ